MATSSWYQRLELEIDNGWDGYQLPVAKEFETEALCRLDAQLEQLDWQDGCRQAARTIRDKLFCLQDDNTFVYLAHGSYGATFRLVAEEVAQGWRAEMERQPVDFFYRQLARYVLRSQFEVAKFCFKGVDPRDIVLCQNVEVGMHSFVNGLKLSGLLTSGDSVAVTEFVYGATKAMLSHLLPGVDLLEVPMPTDEMLTGGHPGDTAFLNSFQSFLAAQPLPPKLLVIEHISSPSAILFPVRQIIRAARAAGVAFIVVDGAHALGAIPVIAPKEMDADCYVTNGHKWYCNARGAAVCYVRRSLQSKVRAPVASWGNPHGFHASFVWQGTSDYIPILTMWMTVQIWKKLNQSVGKSGQSSVLRRNAALTKQSVNILMQAFGGRCLVAGQVQDEAIPMAVIPVPEELSSQASDLNRRLREEHAIEVPVFKFRGVYHFRISLHLYSSVSDAERLVRALEFCSQNVGECELK